MSSLPRHKDAAPRAWAKTESGFAWYLCTLVVALSAALNVRNNLNEPSFAMPGALGLASPL